MNIQKLKCTGSSANNTIVEFQGNLGIENDVKVGERLGSIRLAVAKLLSCRIFKNRSDS